jgi:DNA-binding NarL/FixJ family response regulator
MAIVLIVHRDPRARRKLTRLLSRAGHDAITADPRDSVVRAREYCPQVALIDAGLEDVSSADVLRWLRQASPNTAVAMLDSLPSVRSAVEAMQLGAADYLDQSQDLAALPATVARLASFGSMMPIGSPGLAVDATSANGGSPVPHAITRWVRVVLPVIDSPSDLKTIAVWARWVAASSGAIRNWCRTAGLSAKRSLSLARMLRVVTCDPGGTHGPENLLDFVDTRSLASFLKLGSATARPYSLPLGVDEFLSLQQWITDPIALRELIAALRLKEAGNAAKAELPGEAPCRVLSQSNTT